MTTHSQNFRVKVLTMIKEAFGSTYTQYRFNKLSNFITHEEFLNDEAVDNIIELGKELERMKNFKKMTNEELNNLVKKWQSDDNQLVVQSVTNKQSDAIYAKDQGIMALGELERRRSDK